VTSASYPIQAAPEITGGETTGVGVGVCVGAEGTIRTGADFFRAFRATGFFAFFACAGFFLLAILTAARNALCAFFASLPALRAAFLANLNARLAAFNLVFSSFAFVLVISKRPSAARTFAAAADTSGELGGEAAGLEIRCCMAVAPR
jgi:hypothetical protein